MPHTRTQTRVFISFDAFAGEKTIFLPRVSFYQKTQEANRKG